MVNVSWNDAIAFCEWLTTTERAEARIRPDQQYTLPTEAQWEYACRGPNERPNFFSFGNDGEKMKDYANVRDASFRSVFSDNFTDPIKAVDGFVYSAPVGSFKANEFGLYDMHGNVWEWCMDIYDPKAYKSRVGQTKDPMVNTGGTVRVIRGGSWHCSPVFCRTAGRFGFSFGPRNFNVGFRVALISEI